MPPRCCPATAPRRGAPFPPPGPRGTSSPASAVLWSAPIPGRPCRPTSLPSQDGYHPVRLCSSLHTSPTPAWGQGCSGQATPLRPVGIEAETAGRPKFLENPHFRLPCSIDAGRTAGTRPVQCRSVAPGIRKAKAPTKGLSTLNSMAFGLAAYASSPGLPHSTQDSLPAVGQTLLDGLSPAGFLRKVSEV